MQMRLRTVQCAIYFSGFAAFIVHFSSRVALQVVLVQWACPSVIRLRFLVGTTSVYTMLNWLCNRRKITLPRDHAQLLLVEGEEKLRRVFAQ